MSSLKNPKFKFILILGLLILSIIGFNKIKRYKDYNPTVIIETHKFEDQENKELLSGNKITEEFISKNNNLGIISVLFNTHNRINDDYLLFSIKEKGQKDWYYTNKYKVDQFQNNEYFPFGFPIINKSKNKQYKIEIESISGINGNSVQIITKENPFLAKYSFPKKFLLQNKNIIPVFVLLKISSFFKHIKLSEYLYTLGIMLIIVLLTKLFKINLFLKKNKTFLHKRGNANSVIVCTNMNKIVSYIVASIVAISVFYINNENFLNKLKLISKNTNMVLYLCSILLFCSVFFISFLMMQKFVKNRFFVNYYFPKKISGIIIITFIILFLWIIQIMSKNSSKLIGYMSINETPREHVAYILLLIYCFIFSFRKLIFKKNKTLNNKIFWLIMALLISITAAFFFYAPNSILYNYNYDAYYNSVYIHQQGIPYSENFFSIYGHYAIFFRLIFKFISINPYTIAGLTAFIGFISVLCIVYVIYNFIKTPFLRLLGLGALIFPVSGFMPFPYPQTYPHRLLFPSILMALGTYLVININTKRKRLILAGYIISALAIIWNNDTGIICLVAWGSLHTYLLFSKRKVKISNLLILLLPIASMSICFYCAWKSTSIYNMVIGGKNINLYYFLFPLLENNYMYNILHIEIPIYITYWMPTLLLFYIFLGQSIASISFIAKKLQFNGQISIGFFISVLGIGQFMYFMNRCAYFNLLLCYYQTTILLLFISEYTISAFFKNKKNILDTIKTIIFYCSVGTLVTLTTIMFINIKLYYIPYINGYINMSSLTAVTEYINTKVEKDTPIISINTATLGIALGWKNELGFIDLPDLFLTNNKEYIINTLINYGKPFLIEKSYYEYFGGIPGVFYIPACDNFKKIKNKYNIIELTEMNKIPSISNLSTLLYLTPKK